MLLKTLNASLIAGVENIAGTGENTGYQHFLLFSLYVFQMDFPGASTVQSIYCKKELQESMGTGALAAMT